MGKQYGLLVDLDRCTGCYACEVACAEWHNVPVDKKWIYVKTIGPELVNGKLRTDFVPVINEGCNLCQERWQQNLSPLCVATCLTQAMRFVQDREALELLSSGKRYQIAKLSVVE